MVDVIDVNQGPTNVLSTKANFFMPPSTTGLSQAANANQSVSEEDAVMVEDY